MSPPRFHLAFPVRDIETTRHFYAEVLGCQLGRSAERWLDFDFYGHQLSAHLCADDTNSMSTNEVDQHAVPARHFGVILATDQWQQLVARLNDLGVDFYIQPYTRFPGAVGEQQTFFIKDPSDNYLEFKTFPNEDKVFSTHSDT